MRKYIYDFSVIKPVDPSISIAEFPRYFVDRLFTKKTHQLDWFRFFLIGMVYKFAREGKLDATGRYRLELRRVGIGHYEGTLSRSL